MPWRLSSFGGIPNPADAFRRIHEAWLSRAMESRLEYPRIPIRQVDKGGFDHMLSRPRGRELADRWWEAAFDRMED